MNHSPMNHSPKVKYEINEPLAKKVKYMINEPFTKKSKI